MTAPEVPLGGAQGEDSVDLRGFEVGGTITTGVRIFCIRCERWFAEWSSRQKFPCMAEMVDECENHVLNEHQPEELER